MRLIFVSVWNYFVSVRERIRFENTRRGICKGNVLEITDFFLHKEKINLLLSCNIWSWIVLIIIIYIFFFYFDAEHAWMDRNFIAIFPVKESERLLSTASFPMHNVVFFIYKMGGLKKCFLWKLSMYLLMEFDRFKVSLLSVRNIIIRRCLS